MHIVHISDIQVNIDQHFADIDIDEIPPTDRQWWAAQNDDWHAIDDGLDTCQLEGDAPFDFDQPRPDLDDDCLEHRIDQAELAWLRGFPGYDEHEAARRCL